MEGARKRRSQPRRRSPSREISEPEEANEGRRRCCFGDQRAESRREEDAGAGQTEGCSPAELARLQEAFTQTLMVTTATTRTWIHPSIPHGCRCFYTFRCSAASLPALQLPTTTSLVSWRAESTPPGQTCPHVHHVHHVHPLEGRLALC